MPLTTPFSSEAPSRSDTSRSGTAASGRDRAVDVARLTALVVALAFVPALTRLATGRATAGLVAALLSAAAVVDGVRFAVGMPVAGAPNFVIVWLIPMVLGVAYARRLIGRRPALAVGAVAFLAEMALVVIGRYDVALVVTGAERVSNVSPPTLLLALQCTWMSCAFVAVAGALRRWADRPRVWRVVAVGNGGAMTLYLWHVPAIAISMLTLHALDLDAYDVHAPGLWSLLALRAAVFVVVMGVTFRLLLPLEHHRLPWWDSPVDANGARSTIAGALTCAAGIALVMLAKTGLTGPSGWSALGCFLAAAAGARFGLTRSVGSRRDCEPDRDIREHPSC